MNRVLKSAFYLTTALSLGATVPAIAWAQDNTATAAPQEMEQIIVTATRREERLQDVPISITVFNQQQLSNHNVINAEDLAAYTPSLGVNNDFGSQNTSFSIRGFSQDIGTQPTVGVYFADVVAPRGPAQGTAAGDGAGPGDFFDLQNVQVLKGPQGTLFGLNTTGGDVLLVPQKPTDEFGGYVEGSTGNFGMWDTQGVINIPVNDHIRLRFGVDHMTRNGYLTNTSGIGPGHFDDVDYTAVRASADIDVTSNFENYTIATYTYSSTNGDVQKMMACDGTGGNAYGMLLVPVTGICGQLTPPNSPLRSLPYPDNLGFTGRYQGSGFYDVAQNDTDPYDKYKQWRVINTTTWHASDNLTIKNIASYAEIKQELSNPLFGVNMSVFGSPLTFLQENLLSGIPNTNELTYTEEFQLQGNQWDNRLIWQAGLYLEGSDPLSPVGYNSPDYVSCSNGAALQCSDPLGYIAGEELVGHPVSFGSVNYTVGKTSYSDYAAYAQTTYKLTDEIKLTGGIRYTMDREANTSNQITYTFGGSPVATSGTPECTFTGTALPNCYREILEHSDAPTWLLDVDYTPNDNILAYAKYSRGYRSGLIVQNISSPFDVVHPERVDAYEVGAKTSFDGPVKGTFDVAGFYNDFTNQQVLIGFEPLPGEPGSPTAAPVNGGTSHIFGAELETTIIPYDGVTLDFAYTYLYAALVRVNQLPSTVGPYAVFGSIFAGDPLELSPRDKLSFTPSYTLPLDDRFGQITLSATFTHTDRQLTNYEDGSAPATPAPFGVGLPINTLDYLPPTNLLDVNINWKSVAGKPVDLSFFATNVTGEKYYNWIPGIGSGYALETAEVGPPCFYGVRLRFHFGQD